MQSELIKENYELACKTESDINQHLPTLYELSKECSHITEMGVRSGIVTGKQGLIVTGKHRDRETGFPVTIGRACL